MGRPTVLESFDEAEEVVIVRAFSVESRENTDEHIDVDGVRSTTMIVEMVFKGKLKDGDEFVFGQGGGGLHLGLHEKSIGHQFLFNLTWPDKSA